MEKLTLAQALIAMVVAIWTATKTILDAAKASNKRRDLVIIGKIKEHALTEDHRRLIMYNDWLPISLGAALLCLAAAAILVALPWYVADPPWYLFVVSLVIAGAFSIAWISWLVGGYYEWRAMERSIMASRT